MPYSVDMKAHLTRYKQERLGVLDNGIWIKNRRQYGHILPQSLFRLNVLETIRREFWNYVESVGIAAVASP